MRRSNRHHVFHCSNIRKAHAASSAVLALGLLACSGKLAVLNERVPGEPGSDPDSMSGAGGSTSVGDPTGTEEGGADSNGSSSESSDVPFIPVNPSLANCPELVLDPSSNRAPATPIACGKCWCENGETVCDERGCQPPKGMARCQFDSPDAVTWGGMIRGDTLFLNAKGYGGCGDVDLIPCYIQPELSTLYSQSHYPREATIHVLNPTPPSECNQVVFQTLQIGLDALVEFRADEGNLVDTNYGLAQIGELSCGDAGLLAQDQVRRALVPPNGDQEAEFGCETDSDCISPSVLSSCAGGCVNSSPVNQASFARLSAEVARIESDVCAPVAESCSAMYPGPRQECEGEPVVCRNHHCVQAN